MQRVWRDPHSRALGGSKRCEEVDPFTREEVTVFLNATLEHFGFDCYVLLLTAFHGGLRSSELAGLHWTDFDPRNKFSAGSVMGHHSMQITVDTYGHLSRASSVPPGASIQGSSKSTIQ